MPLKIAGAGGNVTLQADPTAVAPVQTLPNLSGTVVVDASNSPSVAFGKCVAWANFNSVATTPVLRGSGNVSSLTDGGVGLITFNLANALPSAAYAVHATGDMVPSTRAALGMTPVANPPTTTAIPTAFAYSTTYADVEYGYMAAFL